MRIFHIFHEEILEHFFFLICGAYRLHQLLLRVALNTGPELEAGSIHAVLIITFVDRETIFFCLSTFVSCYFVTFCLANVCSYLSFPGTVLVVSVSRRLSPNCEGIPAGRPMSPGVKNNDKEVSAGGPMSHGVWK